MVDIEKLLDSLNIPKQLLDKSEALLKTLFGPSFEELGGLIADQVKLRRFNNQVKILTKAREKLQQNNINPQKVSLKVLAPLIEYSSLEEEESLQDKWSNLISRILGGDKEVMFHQNCITILSRISAEEARLLDKLHELLQKRKNDRYQRQADYYSKTKNKYSAMKQTVPKKPDEYSLDSFAFNMAELARDVNVPIGELEFSISNLVSLGLLKWETDVDVTASKSSDDPEDTDIDVDVNVYNNDDFIFTSVGNKFVNVCKG